MVSSRRPTSLTTTATAASVHDHPCFRSCSRRTLAQLERSGTCVAVAPGGVLQRRQRTQWVYFVLSGTVAVDAGEDAFLVGAGGTIGLAAAFASGAPVLGIDAATTAVVYVVSREDLRAIALANPALLEQLAMALAHHPT